MATISIVPTPNAVNREGQARRINVAPAILLALAVSAGLLFASAPAAEASSTGRTNTTYALGAVADWPATWLLNVETSTMEYGLRTRKAVSPSLADQSRVIRLPVHVVERLTAIARVSREFEQQEGRRPTPPAATRSVT